MTDHLPMGEGAHTDEDAHLHDDAADNAANQNVHRLLSEAYLPEEPPAEFRARERGALRALAADLARQRAAAPAAPSTTTEGAPVLRPNFGWQYALVAAVLLIGFAMMIQRGAERPENAPTRADVSVERRGSVVWIDGKPYVPQTNGTTGVTELVPAPTPTQAKTTHTKIKPGVTPRKKSAVAQAPLLRSGEGLDTRDGPRRVRLQDGSVLYVDRGSALTVTGHRAVRLERGRLFVEVSPREGNDPGATFVVKTDQREVKALGTKFAVVAQAATEVLVTQGRVAISGVRETLRAGWKMRAGSAGKVEVTPLSRMSHELDWTRELIRASETPLVPGSKHTGGALIAVDPFGQETSLTLRSYGVDVQIEDGFARTTIDQTYFNHHSWRMEGTFYFPLPPGASISRLAMYVNGKRMEGGMAERDHARSVFEEIRHTRRDPALLEWLDGSTFKMRVFPLEGRQEKRIVLSYVQRLESAYGKTTYRFPSGHSLGVVGQLAYRLRVKGHGARSWSSPSHPLVATPAAGDLELGLERRKALMKDDLVVQLDDPTTVTAQRPRLTQRVHEGQRYLMLRTRPALKRATPKTPTPKTYVFLFESSGDRDPLLARTQMEVVQTFLDNAEHQDEFALLTAGTRLRAFAKQARPVSPSTVREAMSFLSETHLIGALDLGQAFDALAPHVTQATQRGREAVVVHVGSGIPALSEREQQKLVARVPTGARYVGVGVGKRWGRSLMKRAAATTGGVYARINPDEEVRWRAYEVFSLLSTPTLTDLAVRAPGAKASFLLADEVVHHGGEVCAVTRLPASAALPTQLVLEGKLNGKPFSETIDVADVREKAGYLPRFWALLELDRLIAAGAVKHKTAIVKLSMQSYVMSPFTSLLVLETEQMYTQFKVDRGRSDHWAAYACPETIKVVHEPVSGGPAAVVSGGKRAPAKRVLDTVRVRLPAPILTQSGRTNYSRSHFRSVNQLLAGGAHSVGYLDDVELSSGGVGRWGGYDYRDASGQTGMQMWAARNGLLKSGELATRSLSSRGALFRDSARPLSGFLSSEQLRRRGDFGPALSLAQLRTTSAQQQLLVLDGLRTRRLSMGGRKMPEQQRRLVDSIVMRATRRLEATDVFYKHYEKPEGGEEIGGDEAPWGAHGPLFQAPAFTQNLYATFDLLAFAPGLNTSGDDVAATLRAEARPDPSAAPGTVDPTAATLIARARRADWTSIRLPATTQSQAFTLVFDGQGRFAYERVLACGLREVVVCDGTSLLHTYPELGLGARRVWSPAYLPQLQRFAPWVLPSASELARGHDVALTSPTVVAITPRKRDPKAATVQTELVFGPAGALVTRRRVRVAVDGTRKIEASIDLAALRVERKAAGAPTPALKPKTSGLVVLPLPFRTRAQTQAALTAKLGVKAFKRGVATWPEADALAWLAAHLDNQHQLQQITQSRFFSDRDRRVGFYVLLVAAGGTWNDGDRLSRFSADLGPVTALEVFLDTGRKLRQRWDWAALYRKSLTVFDSSVPLLRDLARLHHVLAGYQSGLSNRSKTSAQRQEAARRTLGWAQDCGDARVAWALTQQARQQGWTSKLTPELTKLYQRFARHPQLGYAARYLGATLTADREALLALHAKALGRGGIPAIDQTFVQVLNRGEADRFTRFVRETAQSLIAKERHAQLPALAWQCWQLGQRPSASEVLDLALGELPPAQLEPTLMNAVTVLWKTGQLPRAAQVIERLHRSQPDSAKRADLWRLTYVVAQRRGQSARALEAFERALELEYAELPEVVNLQRVRTDFGALMTQYLAVANALSTLEQAPPQRFLARVVRAADRWRSIDPVQTQACQLAARILQSLGNKALAWDYLTTPIALSPAEAKPWLALAQLAQQWNDVDLADRCYANAFAAEATNAQILWSHAQLLQQSGQGAKAKALYRKLADGKWQPRFQWIQQQAKQYVGG